MNPKILVAFLLLCSLIVAGCVTDNNIEENGPDEDQTEIHDGNNETSGMDNGTQSDDDVTSADGNETLAEDDVEVNEGSGVTVVESTGPRTYRITLKNFLAQPSNVTINEGDSVFWINMNQPARNFVLVSDEGLWEDRSLVYRNSFTNTFNETGTYNYHIRGFEERMKGTITVK
ncbi:plastocyanin/azurin family copper-binding protein [Methanolobus halotolerans]|uniref:Blue (type 1) copper domain-containing protein n=1 Tax=Methanolobus halotolerans TaxID=2052935 RepID=A0A4E0Q505_9EURY|nr:plastocyanin/azurin family copper-binding protein [Methanolobus halotolerans]TGC09125.1 hypothetical protein CUN85_07070 [Methanolobus halotolerans]